MEYKAYTESELFMITDKTREISSDPYKLFVALVLSALKDFITPDDIDEDETIPELWGAKIAEHDFNGILNDCTDDFMEAVNGGFRIDIGANSYTIRNSRSITRGNLLHVFCFPRSSEGNLIVSKHGVLNINETQQTSSFAEQKSQTRENRDMAKRIYFLGKTDEGWDKLTDMERAVYTWILFCIKNKKAIMEDDLQTWFNKYKEYFCLPLTDIRTCVNLSCSVAPLSFMASKVKEYNLQQGATSYLEEVDPDAATELWYSKFS